MSCRPCGYVIRAALSAVGCNRGRVRTGPLRNLTGPGDHRAVVEHQDRNGPLTAQALHLCPVPRTGGPGPELERAAFDLPPLVGVAGVVERFCGTAARMGHRAGQPAERLAVGARVEDHARNASAVSNGPLP